MINKQPLDISYSIKGLELLISFRDPYGQTDAPALILSYFDDQTTEWVPHIFEDFSDYNLTHFANGKVNTLNAAHQIVLITRFIDKVNTLGWPTLPFRTGEAATQGDAARFATFLKKVLIGTDTGIAINQTELEKGW